METIKKILLFDIFPFLCRLIASLFLVMAIYKIGFPPSTAIGTTPLTLLIMAVFLFLLPIAKKISLGKLISFEREVAKVKDDVKEFKTETRELLGVYSSIANTISNTVNQSVTVNMPGYEEAQKAKDDLDETIDNPTAAEELETKLNNFIKSAGGDYNYALAKLRMDIERTLRDILGHRTSMAEPHEMKGKFLSARQLFKQFSNKYPKYANLHSSYDYILKVCNAAIHGQSVSESAAKEAIYMGIQLIEAIENASD